MYSHHQQSFLEVVELLREAEYFLQEEVSSVDQQLAAATLEDWHHHHQLELDWHHHHQLELVPLLLLLFLLHQHHRFR